jgi:cell division protein FtsB
MLEFQEKIKLRKFLYSRITLIVLLVILFFLVRAVWSVYQKQEMTRENLTRTTANFNNLQARQEMLSTEIERLKTESGKEQEIREKYGLVRPGEEVMVVVDKNNDAGPDAGSTKISFWQKIKDWLR